MDEAVWQYAQEHAFALVTANPRDFESLAARTRDHRGLLVVYVDRDPATQMRVADLAAAIEFVLGVLGDKPTGQRLVLNEWRRSRR